MNRRLLKVQFVTAVFISLMLLSLAPQAVWASQALQHDEELIPKPFEGYNLDSIYVFYDPADEMMSAVAEGVNEIVTVRINHVTMIPVTSHSDVSYWLLDEPWIAIYALQSNLNGVLFPDREMSWRQFYQTLNRHRLTQHIVGMGNTLSLDHYLESSDATIHHSESEVADALILILYDIWSIREICRTREHVRAEYKDAADDLEKMVLQIYADNLNELIQRSFEPINPVGEVDSLAAEERYQRMLDRHPAEVEDAAFRLDAEGNLIEVPLDELPDDFSPMIQLSELADVDASSFILGKIPLLSGLKGGIGKVVDILLKVLGSAGKTVLSIPESALDGLKDIFDMIIPFLGLVTDFDVENPIKSLIMPLVEQFPFPEPLKTLLEPILAGLFELKGGLGSIRNVITELLSALLPNFLPPGVMDFLSDVLDIGGDLWDLIADVVSNGKGVFDTILSFLTENILGALLNKTLAATLGMTTGLTTLVSKGVSFIKSIVGYLSSFDFSNFIDDVGANLLNTALGVLTGTAGEEVIGKIMSLIELSLSAVKQVNKFELSSLFDLLKILVVDFVGGSGIVGTAEDLTEHLMCVMQDVVEAPTPVTVSALRGDIGDILDSNLTVSVPTSTKTLVTDTMVLMAGFLDGGLTPADVPDIFDIAEGLVGELGLGSTELTNTIDALTNAVKPILGIIASVSDSDPLKMMISHTTSSFMSELGDMPEILADVIRFMGGVDLPVGPDVDAVLDTFGDIVGGMMNLLMSVKDMSFEGIMNALLMSAGSLIGIFPSFDDVPIDVMLTLMGSFFPDAFGIGAGGLSPQAAIEQILDFAAGHLTGAFNLGILGDFLGSLMDIMGIFTDGVKWIIGKCLDWLEGMITPLLVQLENAINGVFGGLNDLLGHNGILPIGLGSWSLFELTFNIGIKPNFKFLTSEFFDWLQAIIFEGRASFSISGFADFLNAIFWSWEITPQFMFELGLTGFDSSKNSFMENLFSIMGLNLQFSGYAKGVVNLFTMRKAIIIPGSIFTIDTWVLSLKVAMTKTITLLDFVTGGVGGGVLSKLASYIGLGNIKIDLWFSIELDIVLKSATSRASVFSLVMVLGAAISLGIDIIVASAKLYGSMEITLSFFQDQALAQPMHILLRLLLTLKLKIRFLLWTWKKTWTWEAGGPWDLSPSKGSAEYQDSGMGFDSDGDGLSDVFENGYPGLDPNNADTDGDGANDKLEVITMGTDPTNPDTDGEGLLDGEEWDLSTNPLNVDTEHDGLDDYEEVKVYGTDPFSFDSDGDGLSDYYEVRTSWDMSGITPTVEYVYIGGAAYNDHTDPLNPDTDGDTILDGDEGPMGPFYGTDSLYNDTPGSGCDPAPIIFNGGYTHPLDADTDDDSYMQLYNGDVDMMLNQRLHPAGTEGQEWPMSDGNELRGFTIILYDDEGEPYEKHVHTNPCNPDTDGDTGVTEAERLNPPPGAWLNSDGYELAQDPPSDPTDGDSDDDGLLDGLEGVLRQDSNHTFYLDPDTDDDGLFDMVDLLLGTDPLSPDTDLDMVSDGDEWFIYGTDPTLADSDFDGLSDGEELFFWHTNPLADDSDGDGLMDGYEVLVTGSDPMDEDSDNDGLNDYEEFFVYFTDTFTYDTDGDGLGDGDEVLIYGTNPLAWDTDSDSITEPNELGEMTWPMSDYHEIMLYGTNATEPDTDMDGLGDAMELYLGSGDIPWMDPIPLDPLSNDTDNDLLLDGAELIIENATDLIYPFESLTVVLRYNTSPVLRDTDNDTLTDYQEIMVFNTNPTSNDTDSDTILDWWEVWVYNTSALDIDTDGDGLNDTQETLYEVYPYGAWPPTNWSIGMTTEDEPAEGDPPEEIVIPESGGVAGAEILAQEGTYPTSATDPDSDDDYLPDGAEVFFYGSNPMDTDTDNDGIPDTLEYDTDYDGLPDGIEFALGLQMVLGGGIFNPDSDHDGLLDGDEYYIHGTDPALLDTDGDGYSDGLEIALGLDPLSFTTTEEFQMALATERGQSTMRIMTPLSGQAVYQDTAVVVVNYTIFQDMWFRYENGAGWSENYTLEYLPASQVWHSDEIRWPTGNITMQVFGRNTTGVIHAQVTWYIVQSGDTPFPWLLLGLGVAAIASVIIVGFVGYKKGWWTVLYGRLRTKPGRGKSPAKKTTKKKSAKKKKTNASSKKGTKGE